MNSMIFSVATYSVAIAGISIFGFISSASRPSQPCSSETSHQQQESEKAEQDAKKKADALSQKRIQQLRDELAKLRESSEESDPRIQALLKKLDELGDQEEEKVEKQAKVDQVLTAHTAEEYVELMDAGKFFMIRLNKKEKKKAAEILRKRYAFKSIEKRLEYELEIKDRLEKLSSDTPPLLNTFFGPTNQMFSRSAALEKLHSDAVEKFIDADMFGFSRMPQVSPSMLRIRPFDNRTLVFEQAITLKEKNAKEIELPKVKALQGISKMKEAEIAADPASLHAYTFPTRNELDFTHRAAAEFFTENAGFVKSRKEVAGFQSHSILYNFFPDYARKSLVTPAPGRQIWKLNRLELVGLLKHDKPKVYVSNQLPNMENLDEDHTRELNTFETEALKKIMGGENTVVRATDTRIIMMGALRANDNCIKCHRAKKGTLLGAFTYEILRRTSE